MSKQTSNSQQQTEQTHAQEELHKANQAPFSWMEEMMTPLQLWQQQFQQGMQQASQAFYDQFAQTAKNPQQYPPFQIWQQQFQQGLEQAKKHFRKIWQTQAYPLKTCRFSTQPCRQICRKIHLIIGQITP